MDISPVSNPLARSPSGNDRGQQRHGEITIYRDQHHFGCLHSRRNRLQGISRIRPMLTLSASMTRMIVVQGRPQVLKCPRLRRSNEHLMLLAIVLYTILHPLPSIRSQQPTPPTKESDAASLGPLLKFQLSVPFPTPRGIRFPPSPPKESTRGKASECSHYLALIDPPSMTTHSTAGVGSKPTLFVVQRWWV